MVRAPGLRRSRRRIQAISAAALAVLASHARADNFTWTNGAGNFDWPVTGNWSDSGFIITPHAYPIAGDLVDFTDAHAGTVFLTGPQLIGQIEFTNVSNSYTIASTNSSLPTTTLGVTYFNSINSLATNTFAASVNINELNGLAEQIYPGSGTLQILGAINAPQGMNINNGDGQLDLENSGNLIGPVTMSGGLLSTSNPAAFAGITSIEMMGSGLTPVVQVTATDGQSVGALPNIIIDANTLGQLSVLHASPTLSPMGTTGLTPTTITYSNLSIAGGSTARISTPYTPYSLGFTTVNMFGSAAITTDAAWLYSPPSHLVLGTIIDDNGGSTLAFDGGGVTTISSNSVRTGTTQIFGGMVVLNTPLGLGTGAITVSAGVPDTLSQIDPGGALDLAIANGAGFPTMINVGSFAALGGNLSSAIYTGVGQNVTLSTDSILFPSSGSALPTQVAGHAAYWLGITSDSATYTVGDGTGSIYKGAALGSFTSNGALPASGFVGTITDAFSQDLLVHASGFTAIGQPSSISNGQAAGPGAGPTLNSADAVADITYDGTGGQLDFFAPISGTAKTFNIANSNPIDSYVALNTSGDVATGQTFNLQGGTTVALSQANDVQGTINVKSGAVMLNNAGTNPTTGAFHIFSGGIFQVTSPTNAPGNATPATYQWDAGSILEFFNATVDTADSALSPQTWVSPNSDVDVDYSNTVTNSLTGVELYLLSTRRITSDKGGELSNGSGLVPAATALPTDTFTFTAAKGALLQIDDAVTIASTQTIQIGSTNTWGPSNLQQTGAVGFGGPVNFQTINIVAGSMWLSSTLPSSSVITNKGNFLNLGTTSVTSITGTGSTSLGGAGVLNVSNINQSSLANGGTLIVNHAATFGSISGGGLITIPTGSTLTDNGAFEQDRGLNNNGVITIAGSGSVGQVSGTGSISLGTASQIQLEWVGSPGQINTQHALTLNGNAQVDVTDNTLEINYGVGNPSPIKTVAAQVTSGFNSGNWNGPGYISSIVQMQNLALNNIHAFGVGYADSSDAAVAKDNFPSGTVVIEPALVGDANLDGVVNFSDFLLLSAAFNVVNSTWDQGNFNYDGKTNFSDFLLLAANFNNSKNVDSSELSAMNQFASQGGDALVPNSNDVGFSIVTVPEPASLAFVGMTATGLLARRRRRRSSPPT